MHFLDFKVSLVIIARVKRQVICQNLLFALRKGKKRLEPSGGQKYGDSQKVSGCGRNEAGSGGGE